MNQEKYRMLCNLWRSLRGKYLTVKDLQDAYWLGVIDGVSYIHLRGMI